MMKTFVPLFIGILLSLHGYDAYRIERQAATEAMEIEPTEAAEAAEGATNPPAASAGVNNVAAPGGQVVSQAGPDGAPVAVDPAPVGSADPAAPAAPAGEVEVETPEVEGPVSTPPPLTAAAGDPAAYDPLTATDPIQPAVDILGFQTGNSRTPPPLNPIFVGAPAQPGLAGPKPIPVGDLSQVPRFRPTRTPHVHGVTGNHIPASGRNTVPPAGAGFNSGNYYELPNQLTVNNAGPDGTSGIVPAHAMYGGGGLGFDYSAVDVSGQGQVQGNVVPVGSIPVVQNNPPPAAQAVPETYAAANQEFSAVNPAPVADSNAMLSPVNSYPSSNVVQQGPLQTVDNSLYNPQANQWMHTAVPNPTSNAAQQVPAQNTGNDYYTSAAPQSNSPTNNQRQGIVITSSIVASNGAQIGIDGSTGAQSNAQSLPSGPVDQTSATASAPVANPSVNRYDGHWVFKAVSTGSQKIRGQWQFMSAVGVVNTEFAPVTGEWGFQASPGVAQGTGPVKGQWIFKPDPIQSGSNAAPSSPTAANSGGVYSESPMQQNTVTEPPMNTLAASNVPAGNPQIIGSEQLPTYPQRTSQARNIPDPRVVALLNGNGDVRQVGAQGSQDPQNAPPAQVPSTGVGNQAGGYQSGPVQGDVGQKIDSRTVLVPGQAPTARLPSGAVGGVQASVDSSGVAVQSSDANILPNVVSLPPAAPGAVPPVPSAGSAVPSARSAVPSAGSAVPSAGSVVPSAATKAQALPVTQAAPITEPLEVEPTEGLEVEPTQAAEVQPTAAQAAPTTAQAAPTPVGRSVDTAPSAPGANPPQAATNAVQTPQGVVDRSRVLNPPSGAAPPQPAEPSQAPSQPPALSGTTGQGASQYAARLPQRIPSPESVARGAVSNVASNTVPAVNTLEQQPTGVSVNVPTAPQGSQPSQQIKTGRQGRELSVQKQWVVNLPDGHSARRPVAVGSKPDLQATGGTERVEFMWPQAGPII